MNENSINLVTNYLDSLLPILYDGIDMNLLHVLFIIANMDEAEVITEKFIQDIFKILEN